MLIGHFSFRGFWWPSLSIIAFRLHERGILRAVIAACSPCRAFFFTIFRFELCLLISERVLQDSYKGASAHRADSFYTPTQALFGFRVVCFDRDL
jgi:hypothetical protein